MGCACLLKNRGKNADELWFLFTEIPLHVLWSGFRHARITFCNNQENQTAENKNQCYTSVITNERIIALLHPLHPMYVQRLKSELSIFWGSAPKQLRWDGWADWCTPYDNCMLPSSGIKTCHQVCMDYRSTCLSSATVKCTTTDENFCVFHT